MKIKIKFNYENEKNEERNYKIDKKKEDQILYKNQIKQMMRDCIKGYKK